MSNQIPDVTESEVAACSGLPTPRRPPLHLWLFVLAGLSTQVWQSLNCSPVYDEAAHLASGIAAVRFKDFGYFRINPPLYRLWSAIPVDLIYAPVMPQVLPAADTPSGTRAEFPLGDRFIEDNRENYKSVFILARLARIPVFALGGWFVYATVARHSGRAASIATILWFTSPLILGHLWIVSSDGFSAAAAAGIAFTTFRWLESGTSKWWAATAVSWGIALSTKFTFCGLYLAWPFVLLVYFFVGPRRRYSNAFALCLKHYAMLSVICIVIWTAYGFNGLLVTFENHNFRSKSLNFLAADPFPAPDEQSVALASGSRALSKCVSPLPSQYLKGIDELCLDFEKGAPSYFRGHHFESGVWWYYLVSMPVKEQLATWLGVAGLIWTAITHKNRVVSAAGSFGGVHLPEITRSMLRAAVAAAALTVALASLNNSLTVHTRYLLPMLPFLYIAIALGLPRLDISLSPSWRIDAWRLALSLAAATELLLTWPHYYAYANPLVGGSRRIPPILQDSNFDWSQDQWYLEAFLNTPRCGDAVVRPLVCMHGAIPPACLEYDFEVPDESLLELALQQHGRPATSITEGSVVKLYIFRGLGVPAPWTFLRYPDGRCSRPSKSLINLLKREPEYFLTPTIAVYSVVRPEILIAPAG